MKQSNEHFGVHCSTVTWNVFTLEENRTWFRQGKAIQGCRVERPDPFFAFFAFKAILALNAAERVLRGRLRLLARANTPRTGGYRSRLSTYRAIPFLGTLLSLSRAGATPQLLGEACHWSGTFLTCCGKSRAFLVAAGFDECRFTTKAIRPDEVALS